ISGSGSECKFIFRTTPNSLRRAHTQGLKTSQLCTLLERWSQSPLPEGFALALEKWEQNGVQITIQPALLLHIDQPDVLEALKKSSVGHLLLEELNPNTIRIHPDAETEIVNVLTRLGYLVHHEP
ncbi:MAG: helicase-associated domain-containing protein, partial [Saprospiraceae bacterium]|nr:helicase-associated domain-containing protein [Saprospiraceae bacterium]